MSKMFFCGRFGCVVESIDDVAASKAEADRIQWATAEKRKRGRLPPESEQIDFVSHAYNRHKNIH